MKKWTTYLTLEGYHTVDSLTDVRLVESGRMVPADDVPPGVKVFIPPFDVKGVRVAKPSRQAKPKAQLMRVRA